MAHDILVYDQQQCAAQEDEEQLVWLGRGKCIIDQDRERIQHDRPPGPARPKQQPAGRVAQRPHQQRQRDHKQHNIFAAPAGSQDAAPDLRADDDLARAVAPGHQPLAHRRAKLVPDLAHQNRADSLHGPCDAQCGAEEVREPARQPAQLREEYAHQQRRQRDARKHIQPFSPVRNANAAGDAPDHQGGQQAAWQNNWQIPA